MEFGLLSDFSVLHKSKEAKTIQSGAAVSSRSANQRAPDPNRWARDPTLESSHFLQGDILSRKPIILQHKAENERNVQKCY